MGLNHTCIYFAVPLVDASLLAIRTMSKLLNLFISSLMALTSAIMGYSSAISCLSLCCSETQNNFRFPSNSHTFRSVQSTSFHSSMWTIRDLPMSATCPRLKNSKRTSKYQRILFYRPQKNFLKKCLTRTKKLKGGTLWDFSSSILLQNSKNMKGNLLGNFFSQKGLATPKKTERGILWSRLVLYVTRETFLVQLPGPTGAI